MKEPIYRYLDHTLLRPDATETEILKHCEEGRAHQCAAVCILPVWAKAAHRLLENSPCKVCSVVGFPLGAHQTAVKEYETSKLIQDGVQEIDMVIHIGALKSGFYQDVEHDIKAVVNAAQGMIVKVILETCLLTDAEKRQACTLAVHAGAHFVKTSTGFSKSGATIHDVKLLREAVGPNFGVKASGGIRTYHTALEMINAGANRIGTSAAVAIIQTTTAAVRGDGSSCPDCHE